MTDLIIELKGFPTHIRTAKTSRAKKQYTKISGNNIYSANMHHNTRAKVVEAMHNWLERRIVDAITEQTGELIYFFSHPKFVMECEYHVPRNYGTVKMLKSGLSWKPCTPDYRANWDENNLTFAWNKIIMDCIVRSGYIQDDNVDFVISSSKGTFVEIDNLDERKIVVILKNNL